MTSLLCVALLTALALAAPPAPAAAPSLPDPATPDPVRLSNHVRRLASDEFEGREPGTAGEQKTVDYLIAQMKAAGLQPGGPVTAGARRWTQDVPLTRFSFAGPLSVTLAMGGHAQPWTQGQEIAVRPSANGRDTLSLQNVPLVFAGYGVSAPERRWDDFKGVDVRGRIVLVLINDPDFETGSGDFGGKAETYYGRWTYKYEEAVRRGAAGVLIIHEDAPASYGWATVVNSGATAVYDIVREDPAKAHSPLEGWVRRDVAVTLFKQAGLDFETLKKQAQTRDFKPVTLPGITLSAAARVSHETVVSRNVLGLLPGSNRPGETLIYSAHWDHFGIHPPDARGDRILNGAADNATGVAGLLELARLFGAAPRPARSIVFLATTAEERGLLGAEYYATHPVHPLETTVADLNMDILGVYGPTRDVSTFGEAQNTLLTDLIDAARAQGRTYTPDPSPEAGHFFRSDHFALSRQGVPALSFAPGDDLVEGGVAAGRAHREDYFAHRYHQAGDEWSPAMDFRGEAQDIALLLTLGQKLSAGGWPEWNPGSEFKAARDASADRRR